MTGCDNWSCLGCMYYWSVAWTAHGALTTHSTQSLAGMFEFQSNRNNNWITLGTMHSVWQKHQKYWLSRNLYQISHCSELIHRVRYDYYSLLSSSSYCLYIKNQIFYKTTRKGLDITSKYPVVLASHWSSSYNTALSLVESSRGTGTVP